MTGDTVDLGAVYELSAERQAANPDLPASLKVCGLALPARPDASPPMAAEWSLQPTPFGAVFSAPPASLDALGYRRVKAGPPAPAEPFTTPADEVGR